MSDPKATKATKGKRSTPKGLYVNLPEELRKEIEERCEESFRSPGSEIAWIVREYLNREADVRAGKIPEVRPGALATGS